MKKSFLTLGGLVFLILFLVGVLLVGRAYPSAVKAAEEELFERPGSSYSRDEMYAIAQGKSEDKRLLGFMLGGFGGVGLLLCFSKISVEEKDSRGRLF